MILDPKLYLYTANELHVLLFLLATQTSCRNTHSSWSGCTTRLDRGINTMQFKEDRSEREPLRSWENLASPPSRNFLFHHTPLNLWFNHRALCLTGRSTYTRWFDNSELIRNSIMWYSFVELLVGKNKSKFRFLSICNNIPSIYAILNVKRDEGTSFHSTIGEDRRNNL